MIKPDEPNLTMTGLIRQITHFSNEDAAKIVFSLSHMIPSLKKHFDAEVMLGEIRNVLNDPITRRTQVVLDIRRLADDPTLLVQDKLQKIRERITETLNNPPKINFLLFKYYPTHPDTTNCYKKIYKICTTQEWAPKPMTPDSNSAE